MNLNLVRSITSTILALVLLQCISSCAQLVQFQSEDDSKHPAAIFFVSYAKAVRQAESFDELLPYFSTQAQKKIPTLKGWYRMAYTSSWYGLRTGTCEETSLKLTANETKAEINCIGPFLWQSPIIGDNPERMQIRQFMTKTGNSWTLETSGIQHTQFHGDTRKMVSRGILFEHSITPKITELGNEGYRSLSTSLTQQPRSSEEASPDVSKAEQDL